MARDIRAELGAVWRRRVANGDGIRVPRDMAVSQEGRRVLLRLTPRGCGLIGPEGGAPYNMQDNGAAFESWAAAVYAHYLEEQGTVTLSAEGAALPPDFPGNQHYCRFLFRAKWFAEHYPWFTLSPELEQAVAAFSRYLESHRFTNNQPTTAARDKGGRAPGAKFSESQVEGRFAGPRADRLRKLLEAAGLPRPAGPIYRQLPVGLFQGTVAEGNSLFTGHASAIDLWTLTGDTMVVMELKYRNKMVGAVTELLFYAAYCHSLLVEQDNTLEMTPPDKALKDDRGYRQLWAAAPALRRVAGVLLLDEGHDHPLITQRVLKVLNGGAGGQLTFHKVLYRDGDLEPPGA